MNKYKARKRRGQPSPNDDILNLSDLIMDAQAHLLASQRSLRTAQQALFDLKSARQAYRTASGGSN